MSDSGDTSVRLMRAIAESADLLMLEIYQATSKTGKSYDRDLAFFKSAAELISNQCPALLPKTVITLVTAQNYGNNFAKDAEYDITKWLRVQISNIPRADRETPGFAGVGQWVSGRSRVSDLIVFDEAVREFFLGENIGPLPEEFSKCTIKDPSFESSIAASPWSFSGGTSLYQYADVKPLPDNRGYSGPRVLRHHDWRPGHGGEAFHNAQFLQLSRGTTPSWARQTVDNLVAGSAHNVFVYTVPRTPIATGTIQVLANDGRVLAKASERMHAPCQRWVRLSTSFVVPSGVTQATIELTDAESSPGESVAFDFAGLSPLPPANAPMVLRSVSISGRTGSDGVVGLRNLPVTIEITGENFLPDSIVRVGADWYCEAVFVSATVLRVTVPRLPAPGEYNITVSRKDWLGDPQSVTLSRGLKVRDARTWLIPVMDILMLMG